MYRGESLSRYAMGSIAFGIDFGAPLREVASTSLGLRTELAEPGDKKEELESDASDWRCVALVLKYGQGGTGHVGLESGRFDKVSI